MKSLLVMLVKDTIEGGAGNDTIDGGAGSDTAVFRDIYESYTLTYNDDGSLTVKHNPSSSELMRALIL